MEDSTKEGNTDIVSLSYLGTSELKLGERTGSVKEGSSRSRQLSINSDVEIIWEKKKTLPTTTIVPEHMARYLKSLHCKHGELSLDPQVCGKDTVMAYIYILSNTGKAELSVSLKLTG